MSKIIKRICPACHEEKEFRSDVKTCGCGGTNPFKKLPKTDAKIVFLDVETSPSLGWVWSKWETNVLEFEQNGYMLSFSYKYAGNKQPVTKALPDYPMWKKNRKDDSELLKELWGVLNEADIVIAHNGDGFDLPTIYTRFVTLGLRPPRPVQTVDTLKIARNKFKFKSNKLDDLGRDLGIGRKLAHTGVKLWLTCMQGDDLKSWKLMKKYNTQDVLLLEELYYRFLPWANTTHPNVNFGNDRCPRCGSEDIQSKGFRYTNLRAKERYLCETCTSWFEGSAKKPKKGTI